MRNKNKQNKNLLVKKLLIEIYLNKILKKDYGDLTTEKNLRIFS